MASEEMFMISIKFALRRASAICTIASVAVIENLGTSRSKEISPLQEEMLNRAKGAKFTETLMAVGCRIVEDKG